MENTPNPQDAQSRRWRAGVVALAGVVVLALAVALALHGGTVYGSAPTPDELTDGGPQATVTASDLRYTVRVSPGPYFLGELVAVRTTLTNNSGADYRVQGMPRANFCAQALWTQLTGGTAPTYALPNMPSPHCAPLDSTLHPGDTWDFASFLPLTASGDVTLTAQARFLVAIASNEFTTSSGPFADHWPTLHLAVSPTVPPDRVITLSPPAAHIAISAPPAALSRLYTIYIAQCGEGDNGGGAATMSTSWEHLSGTTLDEPAIQDAQCNPGTQSWTYSIAAPGYAIASGTYPA